MLANLTAWPRRFDAVRPSRAFAAAFVLSLAVSLLAYGPEASLTGARIVGNQCVCGDAIQQSWFLGWVPWALLHGHNPLFTSWMDYPSGANLALNTEMPLLGVVAAPVTLIFGSVATFNLLMWLAFPLSAISAFWVLRKWSGSNTGALVGSALYGFSPYLDGQAYGHLNLTFVPFPPLIFYLSYLILTRRSERQVRTGLLLGVVVSAQFLISPEIAATTGIIVIAGAALWALSVRRLPSTADAKSVTRGAGAAVCLMAIVLAYPIYYMVLGPWTLPGPVQGSTNPFRSDLLAPLVPTSAQWLGVGLAQFGDRFTGGVFPENGGYLGAPLLLLVVVCLVRYRHDRRILLAGGLVGVAFLLSLGPTLTAGTHGTTFRLPFDLIVHLPLFKNILPSRFSLYEQLFVGTILALAIARAIEGLKLPGRSDRSRTAGVRNAVVARMALLLLAAISIVSLIPRWPIATTQTSLVTPPFFTSGLASKIPTNSVVLTYPFSVSPANQAMLWQEDDHFRWKIVGGYALLPGIDVGETGGVSAWPPALSPLSVQDFFGWEELGAGGYLLQTPPTIGPSLPNDLRSYVKRYGIDTAIVYPFGKTPDVVSSVFEKAFGPPVREGGVEVWFHLERTSG